MILDLYALTVYGATTFPVGTALPVTDPNPLLRAALCAKRYHYRKGDR